MADMLHLVNLVHRGPHEWSRAQVANIWYPAALGAVALPNHHVSFQASRGRRTEIHHIYYFRIGPPERGIILEVRDAFGDQRIFINVNEGNMICCLSSLDATALRDHIMNTPIIWGGDDLPPTLEETAEHDGDNYIYKIRDPFGFKWIIMSTQLLPDQVFQWQNNRRENNPREMIYSAHLMYLMDRPRATQASTWYQQVLGCVALHNIPFTLIGINGNVVIGQDRYLSLGNGNRRVILEIRDAIRGRQGTADDRSYSALYSTTPGIYHDVIMAFYPHGNALRPTTIRRHRFEPENRFVAKIRDPFGFHWLIHETMPDLLNEVDQME